MVQTSIALQANSVTGGVQLCADNRGVCDRVGHQVCKGAVEQLPQVIVCHNTNCKIAHIHLTLLFLCC